MKRALNTSINDIKFLVINIKELLKVIEVKTMDLGIVDLVP